MGPSDQPDFVNAVAAIRTALAPEDLLDVTQQIEQQQGRQRLRHWGPRTIDIDILLYADLSCETPRLTIPHPGLTCRDFVILPLYEIAPDLILPGGQVLAELQQYAQGHILPSEDA